MPTHGLQKHLFKIAALIGVMLFVGISWWAVDVYKKTHLIVGVPYWGSYIGTEITTAAGAAAYSVLGFWGDERFSSDVIGNEVFEVTETEDITLADIASFFETNGYETSLETIQTQGELKRMLHKEIPLIISQRMALDAPPYVNVVRVVIGYSNEERTFITHDNNFGNNYEIPYADFAELSPQRMLTLSVEPGPTLEHLESNAGRYPHDGTLYEYPERLSIMDSPAIREIQIAWVTIDSILKRNDEAEPETAAQVAVLWETILENESFPLLHPVARVNASYNLARTYTNFLDEHAKAITLLEEITIPLQEESDVTESFGEWYRKPGLDFPPHWYAHPWALLGVAYYRQGDNVYAEELLEKATTMDPGSPEIQVARDFIGI